MERTLKNRELGKNGKAIKTAFLMLMLIVPNEATSQSRSPRCSGDYSARWTNCQGALTFPGGNQYLGEFKDGLKHGQGTLIWSKGDKYSGDFKYDKRTGQGTYTWLNGNKYIGSFYEGKMHGQGTFTYPNGESHTGEFRNDKPNGKGTLIFMDGRKFIGEFKDANFHGLGIMYAKDGRVVNKGQWSNDKFVRTLEVEPFELGQSSTYKTGSEIIVQQQAATDNVSSRRTTQPAGSALNCELEGIEVVCHVSKNETRITGVSLIPSSCRSPVLEGKDRRAVEAALNSVSGSKRTDIERSLSSKTEFAMEFAQDPQLALPMLAWIGDPTGTYRAGDGFTFSGCTGLQGWKIIVNGSEATWRLQ